jgi:hypothetical protein
MAAIDSRDISTVRLSNFERRRVLVARPKSSSMWSARLGGHGESARSMWNAVGDLSVAFRLVVRLESQIEAHDEQQVLQ